MHHLIDHLSDASPHLANLDAYTTRANLGLRERSHPHPHYSCLFTARSHMQAVDLEDDFVKLHHAYLLWNRFDSVEFAVKVPTAVAPPVRALMHALIA